MWNNYPVMDVASHDGFVRNPALIHSFYNGLRRQLLDKKPNAAHLGLKELEKDFDVRIITQTSTTCTNALEAATCCTCTANL